MNGQSNSTNPYPILNDNGNTIKIASAVGLFGVLVLGVAGALYWRRLRQGDADNSVEKNDTAGISGGGGQKSDSNGYPLCGGPNSAGGVILINTECSEGKSEISGIAPEFYRDSTGSLKAGERVSHANKQLPPIHTFASASRYANDKPQEASPPTLRPDVNQSKFSLIGGLKDFASLMTSKSLAEGKRSAADNTATTESDLPFGVAPGAENQQKAYNGPRKSKVNSVSDTISIWNLITSYAMFGSKDNHTASSLATDGERGPSHQPQHSKQKNQGKSNLNEESFSESLQSAFSGIYGKYQDEKTAGGATSARISQINSQYDYSMQHTTSPLQPQRDSKVYRPQLRGIPTAVQSQAESSTIEMEDVLQQHEYESGSESEIIEEAVDTEEESSIDLMSPLSERLGSLENQLEGQSEESLDLGSGEFEEDGAQLENEKAAPPLQPKMPAIPGWMRDSTTASTQNQAQEKEKEEVEEIKPKKKREPGWLAEMSSEMPGWMAFEDEASIASPKPLIAANEEIPPSPTLPPPPPPVLSLDTIIQQKEALKKQDDISKGKTPTNEAPKLAHKVLPFTAVSDKGPSKTTKTFETSKEWYQPTHVSRELFFGTRSDEMNMGAGDLIHVDTVYDDGWCRATNLSQGKKVGVVPMRYLKAVKGGIGPSRRIVRLVEDIDTGSSDNQKSDDGISKDNLVWVGALNSNDKRKSTDSMRSIITTSGKNPRVDSLL
ncbi:hypothetical protein BDR26DRAFT_850415 [Obelidium mucronatum]|nr:hypothetical protein BDR26DRAFT_850415 [Obelidium mucronatum]